MELVDQLDLRPGVRVLDVGCGLGGASRYMARRFGVRVAGVDLTPEFVEVARELTARCRLDGLVEIQQASGTDWATAAATSFLLDPAGYRQLLGEAEFDVLGDRDRREFALEFFAQMRARIAQDGPPPLGLHIVFGADHAAKTANMIDNLRRREIAPVEMVCRAR